MMNDPGDTAISSKFFVKIRSSEMFISLHINDLEDMDTLKTIILEMKKKLKKETQPTTQT